MSSLSLKFYKVANLLEISDWYCFLTSNSFSLLRLNVSPSHSCAACILTANLSLTFATTRQWSVSQSAPLKLHTSSILECFLLSISVWSMWLWFFPSVEVQVYLWMFWCRMALLTTRFFYVAKFTVLTPLSLISWYWLLFPIVGLKVFSPPTFACQSPNSIFIWYLGEW